MENIKEKIKEIIANHVDITNAKEDTPLNELDIDSLDLVEAMMEIEEAFNIEFENEEILNLKCFDDIVKVVSDKLNK